MNSGFELHNKLTTSLFSDPAKPQITLQDIANCKGANQGYLSKIHNQIKTYQEKGTFITDSLVKEVILHGNTDLVHDIFQQSPPLAENHKVTIAELSNIIGNTSRKMLERMDGINATNMVPVNYLQQAAKKASDPHLLFQVKNDKASNHPLALSMRSVFYHTIGFLATPFDPLASQYYKFKAKHVDLKLDAHYRQGDSITKLFGDQLIAPRVNIMHERSREDIHKIYEEQDALKEKMQKSTKTDSKDAIKIKPASTLGVDGICFGDMVDLAENYFRTKNSGQSTHSFLQNLEEHGTRNAMINQGAYTDLTIRHSFNQFFNGVFDLIEKASAKKETTLANQLADIDKTNVIQIKSTISKGNLQKFVTGKTKVPLSKEMGEMCLFPLNASANNELIAMAGDIMGPGYLYLIFRVCENSPSPPWLKNDTINYPMLERALLVEVDKILVEKVKDPKADQAFLNKRRSQLIREIKLAIAMEEYENSPKKFVTDPFFRKILSSTRLKLKENALVVAKGYDFISCAPLLGAHLNYVDNDAYLKNLKLLTEGFYYISLTTETGGHALSMVVEADGSGYLGDPNLGYIKFNNSDQARQHLNTILNAYSQRETVIPDHSYHQLEIYQLKPANLKPEAGA